MDPICCLLSPLFAGCPWAHHHPAHHSGIRAPRGLSPHCHGQRRAPRVAITGLMLTWGGFRRHDKHLPVQWESSIFFFAVEPHLSQPWGTKRVCLLLIAMRLTPANGFGRALSIKKDWLSCSSGGSCSGRRTCPTAAAAALPSAPAAPPWVARPPGASTGPPCQGLPRPGNAGGGWPPLFSCAV